MENNLSLTQLSLKIENNDLAIESNPEQENANIEKAVKCFDCEKVFDQSFWKRVKTKLKGETPIECINCSEIFCSDCYKNEIRYSRKNPNKKGYSCNNCLEETRIDKDRLFLPVNTVKDSLEDVMNQLLDLKNVAEPIINDKIVPLLNDTKELVMSTQKTVDEAKNYLPTLSENLNSIINNALIVINKSQEKVENIPDLVLEVKKLNKNFSLMLILLASMIGVLFLGEIIIIAKFIFD